MWMNEYEIEDALRLTARFELPVARRAAEILSELKDWTNDHSDGWPYWQKPAKAADKLMTALQSAIGASRQGDNVDMTEAQLKAALTPVKSFLTRHGADHTEVIK
jgi:hypothetical protein